MSFGLTFDKLLVLGIIAVFLLGPERLPYYASQLARLVRNLRDMANGAKDRMREEMGPDFDDIDWKKLDPRQYDPRRIIREALLEDEKPAAPSAPAVPARAPGSPVQRVAVTPLSPAPPSRTPAEPTPLVEQVVPAATPVE